MAKKSTSTALLPADPETIEIKNVGPIEYLPIRLAHGTAQGGVHVFRGRNESGKSTAIKAVGALMGSGDKLNLRRGATSGSVAGYGTSITLGGTTRVNGDVELFVNRIEDVYSFDKLVDPGLKDGEAADKVRVKALISAWRVEPDAQTWRDLFDSPEQFEEIVQKKSLAAADPVDMAAQIKRDVETAARIAEQKAEELLISLTATQQDSQYDPADLIEDMEVHTTDGAAKGKKYLKLKADLAEWTAKQKAVAEAKEALEKQNIAEKSERLNSLSRDLGKWNASITEEVAYIDRIETEIQKLNDDKYDATARIKNAQDKADAVESLIRGVQQEIAALEGYQAIIDSAEDMMPVSEADVEFARQAVDEHNAKADRNAIAQEKKRKRDGCQELQRRVQKATEEGIHLRDLAKRCESVLSDMIGHGSALYFENGRMMTETDIGPMLFSELSEGKRWKLAIEALAAAVPRAADKTALIPLPQRAWESLDDTNRQLIQELAVANKLNIITAAWSNGPLEIETLEA